MLLVAWARSGQCKMIMERLLEVKNELNKQISVSQMKMMTFRTIVPGKSSYSWPDCGNV